MSLNYVTLAANMNGTYDTLKSTKQQDNPNQVPYPSNPGTKWMDDYIVFYDTDANAGTFSAASVVMASMPSLLIFDNNASACSGPTMMAAKLASYWIAQVTPGTPQIDTILSVSNDAAKIQTPIETWLCSQTSTLSAPPYEALFNYIESQVKTIVWTVTEQGGSYSVTIS